LQKRLIDYGFHPYTTAFPLIVAGAMMIEPTESESKEECHLFIDAMKAIAEEAATKPEIVKTAPHTTRVRRLDEVGAGTQAGPALEAGCPTQRSRGLSEKGRPSNRQRPREIPFKAHIRFVARLSWLAPC